MPPLLKKRWDIAATITPAANENLSDFPPYLRQILFNRGISQAEAARAYLDGRVDHDTDPYQLSDMAALVERLERAIAQGEAVAVYGDYDVDGVTATVLLVEVLRRLGANVREYIPNRFEEGYGLNNEALDTLHADGVKLVVTVDCGIRSLEEADHARALGLDLAISDHHHPGAELPRALAVINPKRAGDAYPDKDLAGVGLAYKIAEALYARRPEGREGAAEWLDLVALGTVADLAPLVGENRALVRAGLERIHRRERQGLFSLVNVARLDALRVNATDIGFMLGPRLNAAGRLESALAAFDLLTERDFEKAGKLAQQLDNQNQERQEITREIQRQAEALALRAGEDALLLFAVDPSFNAGVVGLAASRLSDAYYRPAIVGAQVDGVTRASCRSIPEFHITAALDRCADLLERHGGHAAAAGFTVRDENLPALVERLQQIAAEQLGGQDLRPVLRADLEIPLVDLHPNMLKELEWLQPTGYGNLEAVFVSRNVKLVSARPVGREGSHLKLAVSDGWITQDGIAFGKGHLAAELPKQVDVLYTYELNEYMGRVSTQLRVRDIKPAGDPD